MRNLRGRATVRGKPLDEDCKKAIITTHEYGPDAYDHGGEGNRDEQ